MKNVTLGLAAALVGGALSLGTALADCQSDAAAARQELEQKGKALQAAGKKKADPQTLCPLFRAYVAAEVKWVKFLTDNKDWCQIPAEAVQQASASVKKTAATRDKICQVAATGMAPSGPVQPPPQGSMSSALGITTGYSLSETGRKNGVFDTLNGNVLQR